MNGTNPFFNMFGKNIPNPMGNMMNVLSQFQQFRQNYTGTPQDAQNQVQQMLNNGQVSQEQFNQAANLARNMLSIMGRN